MALALLTLFFGLLALWFGRTAYMKIHAERRWPTVQGKVLERGVGAAMGRGRTFMPHAKYTYWVAGKEYVNDQVYLIRRSGGLHDQIQKLVDGLPDPVPVHYDPKDPARSYLLVNPMGTVWLLFGFGVLTTLWALGQLLVVAMK
jgi:hypothetical protein